jgi:predicted acylesterase/phospholipase RssA
MANAPEPLWTPTGITFSSGGIHGNAMNGVLANLIDNDLLRDVTDWYGCSCGSISAALGAMGVDSSAWLRDAARYMDFTDLTVLEDSCINDMYHHWGMMPYGRLTTLLGKFVDTWEEGMSSITFAELAARRPGIRLHIIATNVTRRCQVVFNAANTPNMRVLDAVVTSSAVPLYFTPWISPNGDLHCDGAMMEYYPWACVIDKARTLVVAGYDTMISGEGRCEAFKTVSDYFFQIGKILQKNKSMARPLNWIALNITAIDGLDFSIPAEDRLALFEQGYRATAAWSKFRLTYSLRKSAEKPPLCAPPHTSPSLRHSRTKMLGSPLPHIPSPTRDSRDPQCTGSGRGRRWSL